VVAFALVRRRSGDGAALLSGGLLLLDPTIGYIAGHRGELDPACGLLTLLAVAAAASGRPGRAGGLIGLASLLKPQAWVLVPLVGALIWRTSDKQGLVRGALGGLVAALVAVAPFIAAGRVADLALWPRYFGGLDLPNHVVSANAHNLWVGLALVGLVVLACLARLRPGRGPADPYRLAGLLVVGWFFVTPRAHENHAFLALPLLAIGAAERPLAYCLASAALLANLVLEDPLLVGPLASAYWSGREAPLWFAALTLANVALFGALLLVLARDRMWPGIAAGREAAHG
jgi:hypothetical protein